MSGQGFLFCCCCQSGSKRTEEERARRLELIRERRLEKMYARTRQPNAALRKISEINEDNEAIEQQIVFNARENGFTVLRKLSEEEQDDSGHESEGRSESEIENDSQLDGKTQHEDKEKHHGKMFNVLRWVAKCSKKQKTPQPSKQ
ncbi:unnamed protein product, partial [Mesorhabditis belari]|uniref:Uncharacterized protein n=1 Tax=Mesorhabditis belari TaxID=2138241 RepID=A0AAF3ETR0_9BILA